MADTDLRVCWKTRRLKIFSKEKDGGENGKGLREDKDLDWSWL